MGIDQYGVPGDAGYLGVSDRLGPWRLGSDWKNGKVFVIGKSNPRFKARQR